MRTRRKADMPPAAPVLRGIVMHTQPHPLVRPGRPAVVTMPAVKMHPLSSPVRVEPAAETGLGRQPTYEQAFAEGRKEGYAAGRSAAAAEDQQALQATIDEARGRAIEEGRLQGLREGRKEAQIEFEQAQAQAADRANVAMQQRLRRLDDLLNGLTRDAARQLADTEEDLVALVHEAICRVLGNEAAMPAVIRSMVQHLLARHGQRAQLAVHVHPDDLEALVQEAGAAGDTWRWVGDNSVRLGGVILRSPEGSLDARLETQLAGLREALLMVRCDRRAAASGDAAATLSSSDGQRT